MYRRAGWRSEVSCEEAASSKKDGWYGSEEEVEVGSTVVRRSIVAVAVDAVGEWQG